MTAAAIIASALASGVRVKLDGDRLVLSAANQPDDRLLEELRRKKPEIVEYLCGFSAWRDEDWQALFDERAGIVEFDGGMSRSEAEAAAADEVARLRSMAGPGDD